MDDSPEASAQSSEATVATAPVAPVSIPQIQFMLPRAPELLKWAWGYYQARFTLIFSITIVPFALAVCALVSTKFAPQPVPSIVSVVSAIVGYVASFAVLAAVMADGGTVQSAYARAKQLFFPALWVMALSGLATLGGFALLVVPGIIMSLYLTFALYVLFAEDLRGMAALMRSWHYAEGLLGQILWRSVFLGLVLLLLYIGISMLSALAHAVEGIAQDSKEVSLIGGSLQAFFQTVIFGPLASIYVYGIYRSIRDVRGSQPVSEVLMAKARRRIKIFSSLGIVVLVALIVLAVVSVGLMAKAGIISGDGMKLQPPTAPASGATALLGVVGAIAR